MKKQGVVLFYILPSTTRKFPMSSKSSSQVQCGGCRLITEASTASRKETIVPKEPIMFRFI